MLRSREYANVFIKDEDLISLALSKPADFPPPLLWRAISD